MEDFLGISVEYIVYLQKKNSTNPNTGGGGSGPSGPRAKDPTEGGGAFPNFGLGPFPFIRKGRRGPLRRKLARRLNRSARNANTSKATRQRYARRFGNQAAKNRFQGNVRFNNRGAVPQTAQGFTKPTTSILPKGKIPNIKGVRGPGPLGILFAGLEFGGRKLEGQSNLQAGVGTAASTAGGMAGFAAGAKGGALAGAAIGAMFGGVGAVPGAAIGGFIGGLLGGFGGSALAGGIADKATGVGSEPKFAEGAAVTAPTRALVGEAGPELVLPFGKIGDALESVYREGGSLILGSTLALLNALPGNPAVAKIKADVTSLGGVFGIGDVPTVKKISADKLKKIPDADEFDISNQTTVTTSASSLTDATIADAAVVKNDFFTNENVQLNGNINVESTKKGYEINDGEFVLTSTMGTRKLALSPGMHMGIDLAGPEGSPLYAFMSGKVLAKGWDGGYGNYVVWQGSDGIEHLYGHLMEPAPVEIGQEISSGTVVGLMGNTGRSSGPHLHWETSTEVGHTGMPKSSVLSRFNPLSKYSLGAPVGREIPPAEPTEEDGKGGGRAGKTVSRLRGGFDIEPPVVSTTSKTVRETPVTQQKKVNVAKIPVVIPIPTPPQQIPVPVEVIKEVNTKRTLVIDVFGKGVVN